MKEFFKPILFSKGYFAANAKSESAFEALFALAALFNIKITRGMEMASLEMVHLAEDVIGCYVPAAFYRGFPQSVRELSKDELLFDQALHYFLSYGLGVRDEAGHSVLEGAIERAAFKEDCEVREMSIITEEEAEPIIADYISSLMASSRPLNDLQYAAVLDFVRDHGVTFDACASKDTLVRLLNDTQNLDLVRFIKMSDVIKLVDYINFCEYGNKNIKRLAFRNKTRKFVTAVIDRVFELDACDTRNCFERQAVWCGLLHHIHYQPKSEAARRFLSAMRGVPNFSTYSRFERAMSEGNIRQAVEILVSEKGSAALLRNLTYILSRCKTAEDIGYVASRIASANVVVLIQMIMNYSEGVSNAARNFVFTKFGATRVHKETPEEVSARKSYISEATASLLVSRLRENLANLLKGRLGKVYIDPAMSSIAVPIQESTSQGGLGVLPRGSRIKIEKGKKVRAFTYWEKVNDIDLSVIGLDANGKQREFSWRTMYDLQDTSIAFSGDQTMGYNGGSEYFDVDLEAFRREYPDMKYLIFCDNVYSGTPFADCVCTAGYMLREVDDSGEIFEPKTVKSSYKVTCDSTFAYLFGIDLATNEFVWLNTAREGRCAVAGATDLSFLEKYFKATSVINMASLFTMAAQEIVSDPLVADVVLSDETFEGLDPAKQVRSCDFEKAFTMLG